MAVIHGLGWLFLVLASVIAPRAWQDRPAGAQTLRWRERWHGWSYGNPAERAAFRRRLLDQGAYFWLAARARLRPAYVWAVLGLVACGWVWGIAKARRDWLDEGTYVLTGLLLNLVIKVWFAPRSRAATGRGPQTGRAGAAAVHAADGAGDSARPTAGLEAPVPMAGAGGAAGVLACS